MPKSLPKPQTTIKDCTFYGVRWDAQALDSIQLVAQALLNLTTLFRSQEIHIDAMIKVDQKKSSSPTLERGDEPEVP